MDNNLLKIKQKFPVLYEAYENARVTLAVEGYSINFSPKDFSSSVSYPSIKWRESYLCIDFTPSFSMFVVGDSQKNNIRVSCHTLSDVDYMNDFDMNEVEKILPILLVENRHYEETLGV